MKRNPCLDYSARVLTTHLETDWFFNCRIFGDRTRYPQLLSRVKCFLLSVKSVGMITMIDQQKYQRRVTITCMEIKARHAAGTINERVNINGFKTYFICHYILFLLQLNGDCNYSVCGKRNGI